MKPAALTALIIVLTLAPTGCRPSAVERQAIWAKMGTPARITDPRQVQVLVPNASGTWTPATASLQGMIAIDEPTLEYYQALHAQHGQRPPSQQPPPAAD